MLTDKLRHFYDAVNAAVVKVGKNANAIADAVIAEAFPETCYAAEREGAAKMLRSGVVEKIKKMLTKEDEDNQYDFAAISEDFMPIVKKLGSHSHYVPLADVQEYVHIGVLIQNPAWLDAARKFKRQKGKETLAEADVLDELYHAVVGR